MSATETLPITSYSDETKTYVSSISIKLKPAVLRSINDEAGQKIFEWHTNVATPPNTPVVPKAPVKEEHLESSTQAENQQLAQAIRSKDLFTPAHTFDENDDLKTNLDKFMACERYHSQYQKMFQQGTQL